MKIIPCKQIKCIKFPVCRNKQFIKCTPLREYCNNLIQSPMFNKNKDVWDMLYKIFPRLTAVELESAPKDSNDPNSRDTFFNGEDITFIYRKVNPDE